MSLIDDAKRPTPGHKPLIENPRRKYGLQTARLVQCRLAHGFHPENEDCPDCLAWHETLAKVEPTDPEIEECMYGMDSDGYYWP